MIDGYKMLSANICNQAIYDYKMWLKLKKSKDLDYLERREVRNKISEIERFFCSEWAINLAEFAGVYLDSEKLINKIRKEIKCD